MVIAYRMSNAVAYARILMQNQRMLAQIRDFTVGNGDTPATTLKLCVEESSPAGTHARTANDE
jgi:hypothetical protein